MDSFYKALFSNSGIASWLIGKLLKYGIDTVILPTLKGIQVEMKYQKDVKEGLELLNELNKAKESGNLDEYKKTLDNIFSRTK